MGTHYVMFQASPTHIGRLSQEDIENPATATALVCSHGRYWHRAFVRGVQLRLADLLGTAHVCPACRIWKRSPNTRS